MESRRRSRRCGRSGQAVEQLPCRLGAEACVCTVRGCRTYVRRIQPGARQSQLQWRLQQPRPGHRRGGRRCAGPNLSWASFTPRSPPTRAASQIVRLTMTVPPESPHRFIRPRHSCSALAGEVLEEYAGLPGKQVVQNLRKGRKCGFAVNSLQSKHICSTRRNRTADTSHRTPVTGRRDRIWWTDHEDKSWTRSTRDARRGRLGVAGCGLR